MSKTESADSEEHKSGDSDTHQEVMRIQYENAKQRLNQQREEVKEFSQEGLRTFRIIILLVAGPAAILAALELELLYELIDFLTSNRCAVENICISTYDITRAAFVLLVLSVFFSIIASGYEVRGIHNASNPEDIHRTTSQDESLSDYYSRQLNEYQKRIVHNDKILHIEESLLSLSKVSLTFSVYCIIPIIYVMVTGSRIKLEYLIALLASFVIIVAALSYYRPAGYITSDRIIAFSPIYKMPEDETDESE